MKNNGFYLLVGGLTDDEVKPRLQLESVATLLAKPEPKLEWLIENIWVDQSRGLIAGNPGVGKTWIALDMLLAVTSGQLCMGKFAVKKGAGLLVEEEASPLNLARRLHAMARARGLKDSDLTQLFHITRQQAKIPRDTVELYHFICDNDIKLVVFDSLRRFHTGNENSSTEMQAVLDSFATLNTMTGASIVLIHHLAKASEVSHKPLFERLRGSSDLWAWRDCLMGVEGEEDATESVCSFQFRDAEAQSPIHIKRLVGAVTGAITLEAVDTSESEEFIQTSQDIIAYLKTQFEGASKNVVCKAVQGRKKDVLQVIKQMEKQGLVIKTDGKIVVPEFAGTNGNSGT